MDHNAQLKLQAWLDGELPEAEASEVANWVARDREAAALAEELRNTRNALVGFEADVRLPESREFFWSKIEREIARLEAPAPEPAPKESYLALFRRFLVPASAIAVVLIAGLVLTRPIGPAGRPAVTDIETALADAGAFTYRDYSAGTTLVWLSYPADNEVAESDEMGTVE
jgi:anti-sigma factor RsiW